MLKIVSASASKILAEAFSIIAKYAATALFFAFFKKFKKEEKNSYSKLTFTPHQ
jgi:hypothetical protein